MTRTEAMDAVVEAMRALIAIDAQQARIADQLQDVMGQRDTANTRLAEAQRRLADLLHKEARAELVEA